jgi:hypothetical protein
MNLDPVWPSSVSEIVLWVEIISLWSIAVYAIAPDVQEKSKRQNTFRSRAAVLLAAGVVGASGWFLPAPGTSAYVRSTLTGLLIIAMAAIALVRYKLSAAGLRRYLAECEIGANVTLALASAVTIGLGQVGSAPQGSFIRSGKLAAATCVVAAIVFVFRGGTYIVRSVLDKANAVPRLAPKADSSQPATDVPELNRGRAIGNLERLLMVIVIGLGSYEALGFLVAAKGLIRAREFEDRDFAEYFILGSLASVAVALVTGILLRVGLVYLWRLP